MQTIHKYKEGISSTRKEYQVQAFVRKEKIYFEIRIIFEKLIQQATITYDF